VFDIVIEVEYEALWIVMNMRCNGCVGRGCEEMIDQAQFPQSRLGESAVKAAAVNVAVRAI
jgi:hypothetical protein